jgi:hypothetical protein
VFGRMLFGLALSTMLAVAPALAQQQLSSVSVGDKVLADTNQERAVPVKQRIFTLAWTDILVPAGTATDSASSGPDADSVPRFFTLTWQPLPGGDTGTSISASVEPACQQMILVAVPCTDLDSKGAAGR